jgi:threonine dehydrogenase-like Zn-dependent dehydrogenase
MKTLVCIKPGEFEYTIGELPELKSGQAIIKIRRIGICGTRNRKQMLVSI